MRVLVTGGAGFIGQHLARTLVGRGSEVVALDALIPQTHLDADAAVERFPGEVIRGDICDGDPWSQARARGIEAVVHLAAETGTGQSMYEEARYHRVNVDGTGKVARFADSLGVPVVALSSRAVYGEGRYECAEHGVSFGGRCCTDAVPAASQENDPHRPVSVYGQTKSEGEEVLGRISGSTPVTIIRPQNVIGRGQALHNPYTGVLAAFLAQLREGRPVTVYGDGRQTRDFVHASDLAELIAWCLDRPPALGQPRVLNSGTGVRTSLVEVARLAAAAADIESPEIVHLDVRRAGDIDHACADLVNLRRGGAPMPKWTTAAAVTDFIKHSWTRPGASASAWEGALSELAKRGLTGH